MADSFGIEHEFRDAGGSLRTVSPETVEDLRRVLGRPPFGEGSAPLVVEAGADIDSGPGDLHLEDGTMRPVDQRMTGVPLGYHRFVTGDGESTELIVHPGRCHLPDGLRAWGWMAQLYATRTGQSWGIGDLADLRRLADWTASLGGGFILVNPLGAPTELTEPSPYSPSTRRYRSPLYLRPEAIPGAGRAGERVAALAAEARSLNGSRAIDRASVWRLKRRALEAIWETVGPTPEFGSWLGEQTGSLNAFASWSAKREGASPLVDVERFHAWLQWALHLQLSEASSRIRVVQDLPVGFDPAGFDAFEWNDLVAPGVTIGAPPDTFNRSGQDWGLGAFIPWKLRQSGYRPFVETLRAGMSFGGGLRVDHAMGLFRLWMIPEGAGPESGAYVRFPASDLLGIISLESHRARALVVAEDLGTVGEGMVEAMQRHGMLSSRVLWFEDEPPEQWPEQAMATVTTHDLPTVAGVWSGADLERQLGLRLDVDLEATSAVRSRLLAVTGLDQNVGAVEAVLSAHLALTRSPSMLIGATLEDATTEEERINMPGTVTGNWSRSLAVPFEGLEAGELPRALAKTMTISHGKRADA